MERNLQAFRWGRRFVLDPAGTLSAADLGPETSAPVEIRPTRRASRPERASGAEILAALPADLPAPVRRILEVRVPELIEYQGSRLARDYLDFVERVIGAERTVAPARCELSTEVARWLFKLMAYKDEYEVARLSLRPEFVTALRTEFPDGGKVRYRLHPPVLRALGMKRKLALGPWFRPAFVALRAMRHVRGTPLDLFGYTKIRRTERSLIGEYRDLVESALDSLSVENYERAVELASLPDLVRGYEDIKLRGVEQFRAEADRYLRGETDRAQL